MAELKLGEGVKAVYDKETGDIIVTVDGPPLGDGKLIGNAELQSRFWVNGREFTKSAPESLTWFSADGWRFWLGEEVKKGVWTMGADRGQSEDVFEFGIHEGPLETIAALEERLATQEGKSR